MHNNECIEYGCYVFACQLYEKWLISDRKKHWSLPAWIMPSRKSYWSDWSKAQYVKHTMYARCCNYSCRC